MPGTIAFASTPWKTRTSASATKPTAWPTSATIAAGCLRLAWPPRKSAVPHSSDARSAAPIMCSRPPRRRGRAPPRGGSGRGWCRRRARARTSAAAARSRPRAAGGRRQAVDRHRRHAQLGDRRPHVAARACRAGGALVGSIRMTTMPVRSSAAGQVAVQDLLQAERRDRLVQALLDLERQLAGGDLVDAGAGDDQALAAGERLRGVARSAGAGRACPRSPASHVAASAAPAIAVKRQQRRDVADGVAPAGVLQRRRDRRGSAPVSASGLAVIRIVRALVACIAASVAAVPASCETAIRTPSDCGSRLASNASRERAPSSAAPAIAACSLVPQPVTTTVSVSRIHSAASSASRRRGSVRRAPARPGSSPPSPTAGRHAAPARRSWPQHGTVSVVLPTEPLRGR